MSKAVTKAQIKAEWENEPTLDPNAVKKSVPKALNWYRQNMLDSIVKKSLVSIAKSEGISIKASNLEIDEMDMQNAILARMYEANPDCQNDPYMKDIYKRVVSFIKRNSKTSVKPTTEKKNAPNPHRYMYEKAQSLMGIIDQAVDNIVDGSKIKFSSKSFITENDLSPIMVTKVVSVIENEYRNELVEYIEGNDPDIQEAYSGYTKSDAKRIVKGIDSIIGALTNSKQANKTVVKRPRKKKPVDVKKSVSKAKHLDEAKGIGKGLKPAKVLGKNVVVLYDTKYKKLTVLQSKEGFKIKGTTVYFDAGNVYGVRERQIKKVKEVLVGGKRILNRVQKELKKRSGKATGRLNENTLIVNVF